MEKTPVGGHDIPVGEEGVCPVCGETCPSPDVLSIHVNQHFGDQETPPRGGMACPHSPCCHEGVMVPWDEWDSHETAHLMQQEEIDKAKQREEAEFRKLQHRHGMDPSQEGAGFVAQYIQRVERDARKRGEGIVDEEALCAQREQLLEEIHTRPDAATCVPCIVERMGRCLERAPKSRILLCSEVDFFHASIGDTGWGCGYRNIQMLCSALLRSPLGHALFHGIGFVPYIPVIQEALQKAWDKGFDRQGCTQLGDCVVGTRKWVGATECATILRSFGIRAVVHDFHIPGAVTSKRGPSECGRALFAFVLEYFEKRHGQPPSSFLPPLYLQHQGHARTIIGVEWTSKGRPNLLLLDSSTKTEKLMRALEKGDLGILRRGESAFPRDKYQIVIADLAEGLVVPDSEEYESMKIIRGRRL